MLAREKWPIRYSKRGAVFYTVMAHAQRPEGPGTPQEICQEILEKYPQYFKSLYEIVRPHYEWQRFANWYPDNILPHPGLPRRGKAVVPAPMIIPAPWKMRTERSAEVTVLPCPELREILMPAMAPCAGFGEACNGQCKWAPEEGHVPRGFGGAAGTLAEVRLVLVTAEPADPADGESYSDDAQTLIEQHADYSAKVLKEDSLRRNGRAARFHRNLRRILELCWPTLSFEEQLQKTWYTDAVLCSAVKSGGKIDRRVEEECVRRYLAPQIDALAGAFVIALGGKAKVRMLRHGVRFDATAYHPSAQSSTTRCETTWQEAADKFRKWLDTSR